MNTIQQIIDRLYAYIQQFGLPNSSWYIGVAADPEARLFEDHNVNRATDAWIHHPCIDSDTARSIEQAFLNSGFDGGSGGGDHTTTHVYAYRKGSHTRE